MWRGLAVCRLFDGMSVCWFVVCVLSLFKHKHTQHGRVSKGKQTSHTTTGCAQAYWLCTSMDRWVVDRVAYQPKLRPRCLARLRWRNRRRLAPGFTPAFILVWAVVGPSGREERCLHIVLLYDRQRRARSVGAMIAQRRSVSPVVVRNRCRKPRRGGGERRSRRRGGRAAACTGAGGVTSSGLVSGLLGFTNGFMGPLLSWDLHELLQRPRHHPAEKAVG
jgi:hypothetical protein